MLFRSYVLGHPHCFDATRCCAICGQTLEQVCAEYDRAAAQADWPATRVTELGVEPDVVFKPLYGDWMPPPIDCEDYEQSAWQRWVRCLFRPARTAIRTNNT